MKILVIKIIVSLMVSLITLILFNLLNYLLIYKIPDNLIWFIMGSFSVISTSYFDELEK